MEDDVVGGLLHVSVAFAPFGFQKSEWSEGEVRSYVSVIQLSWTDGRTALMDISSESLVLETLLWGSGIYCEGGFLQALIRQRAACILRV